MKKRRKFQIGLVGLVLGIVVLRLLLPIPVAAFVNAELEDMGDYSGRIAEVDLALFRGAYTLIDLVVEKKDAAEDVEPFLAVDATDLSLQWTALISGELVGEMKATRPVANFIQGESDDDSQYGEGVDWSGIVDTLLPFGLNRVEIVDGEMTLNAPGIDSDDALELHDIDFVIRELVNIHEDEERAFTDVAGTARFMSGAPAKIQGTIDPNEDSPTFDMNFALDDADLVEINPWLREILNVDAEEGRFSLYAEFAAADGRVEGYAKPLLEDANIHEFGEESPGFLHSVWEALVDLGRVIFENPKDDQVATRIPFSGELESPDSGMLATIGNLFRNAFVSAFTHALEGSINLRDVDPDAVLDEDEGDDDEDGDGDGDGDDEDGDDE